MPRYVIWITRSKKKNSSILQYISTREDIPVVDLYMWTYTCMHMKHKFALPEAYLCGRNELRGSGQNADFFEDFICAHRNIFTWTPSQSSCRRNDAKIFVHTQTWHAAAFVWSLARIITQTKLCRPIWHQRRSVCGPGEPWGPWREHTEDRKLPCKSCRAALPQDHRVHLSAPKSSRLQCCSWISSSRRYPGRGTRPARGRRPILRRGCSSWFTCTGCRLRIPVDMLTAPVHMYRWFTHQRNEIMPSVEAFTKEHVGGEQKNYDAFIW